MSLSQITQPSDHQNSARTEASAVSGERRFHNSIHAHQRSTAQAIVLHHQSWRFLGSIRMTMTLPLYHFQVILYFTGGKFRFFTAKKTIRAITKNLIRLDNTLPRSTPCHDNCSRLSIFNFLNTGERISGVMRSSISDEARAVTWAPMISQIAKPITLYLAINSINSHHIIEKY